MTIWGSMTTLKVVGVDTITAIAQWFIHSGFRAVRDDVSGTDSLTYQQDNTGKSANTPRGVFGINL